MKRETYLRHPPINDKIRPVDEGTLVAGEEEHGLSLLDGFAEAAGGEVDLAAVALGGVVAEPVLEEGRAGEADESILYSLKGIEGDKGGKYFNGAGQSALNLNPSLACTIANSLVIANTAPLLAVYASCGVALPTRATTLAVLMMEPRVFLCWRMLRMACLLPNQTPLTLMLWVRSQIFSGVSMASASSPLSVMSED